MRILDWLRGRPTWRLSENGNPTTKVGDLWATVFQVPGGWKFCIAVGDDDDEPFFSSRYLTMDEAKAAALAEIEMT
jgi:hypothetical protein